MSAVTDRRIRILLILIREGGYVKLDSLVEQVEGACKSTIRSDLDYLAMYFPIEARTGIYGGYRLASDPPVFWRHAGAILRLRELCGDMDDNLARLIEQATMALLAFKQQGNKTSL